MPRTFENQLHAITLAKCNAAGAQLALHYAIVADKARLYIGGRAHYGGWMTSPSSRGCFLNYR